MHLAAQTLPFEEPLDEVLEFLTGLGVESIDWRCDPATYLDDPDRQTELLELLDDYGVEISVFGATGYNPLHPDEDTRAFARERIRQSIELASQLGVDVVGAFSGTPGGSPADETPNWIVSPVPPGLDGGEFYDQYGEIHDYQWTEVAIPYWREVAEFATQHGVEVGIELHINTLVNSPVALQRLRGATNGNVGAYVDPGHLQLQNIDPVESIRFLAESGAIAHVEASDVRIYESNCDLKGIWDMTPMAATLDRPWSFCTVGYGTDEQYWKDFISTLDLVGYDGPVSIQHLNTPEPVYSGVEKAASFLNELIPS